ncbi:hypothetical protein LCGC14_0669380 [marine sediment metagenome]|uniref:Uncharacterized protein n=1 Tax=marine sediment metagenome TaxID=412755 RepID=A0A0F9QWL9_9ZZZZ
MIKRLLVCLFLLVPITAQAEITEDNPPGWIINCWDAADQSGAILVTFEHYNDSRPNFVSETWIRIWEKKTNEWTWVFPFGANLICKADKVLE